jgi:alpha/beta superfamily hydrolase
MPRPLYTVAAVAVIAGFAALAVPQHAARSTPAVAVVGHKHPLFLGSMVVTASALPGR